MLAVDEARKAIGNCCVPLKSERAPLSSPALGRILAEVVCADMDMPPHDKAMMDGYAVKAADLSSGQARLEVIEEIFSGRTPEKKVHPGQASRIMTGAPLPEGADAIIIRERTKTTPDGLVDIVDALPSLGQNILPRGAEFTRGQVLLEPGTILRPAEFGVLAAVGKTSVLQIPPPLVAIIATGDELIEGAALPGPGQIRNSNAPMLQAQVTLAGGLPRYLGIARDSLDSLVPLIREGLQTAHVVVLTGGVSAGKKDLVPDALAELQVTTHFHHVRMKPGKPLLFGTGPQEGMGPPKLIFGLPGNPVSSFVCFELFLRPAIRLLAGFPNPDLPRVMARLSQDFAHESDRPTYFPARLSETESGWEVQPVKWFGSADLRGLLAANALMELPSGGGKWQKQNTIPVLRLQG